jgi:RNA recognition motif-containing protein
MPRRRHSESRSPSPDDRHRSSKRRSRSNDRNGSARREGSPHLSKFYRDRFGNASPDSYNNLRLSNFDRKLSNDEVKEILETEFAKYKKFEIKLVRHNGDEDRFAYVNFEENGPAKDVRRTKIPTLIRKLGSRVCLDPTGVIRDQEGKYIPDRYNRSLMDRRERTPERRDRDKERERRRSPPPPPPRHRGRSESPVFHLNRDEPTRTLFVGNIPGDARETEIREILSKFGDLEDVEIKYKANGDASYAFVLFTSIDSADECQRKLNDKPFRRGSEKKFKIGFGKAQISRRLWVGDLGSWTTREMLEKEFDRYGTIEDLEYKEGAKHAYITYNEITAATDACKGLQGATLDRTHQISVDFAKISRDSGKPRKRQHSSSSPDDSKRRRGGPRTPSISDDSRTSSPVSPRPRSVNESVGNGKAAAAKIETVEELREQYAATWKGPISLKKSDYVINLHRIAGKESILQDYLRDEDGRVLKLNINQRLPLDDSLFDKITTMDTSELAVCIGAEHDRTLSGLITYMREKSAAGVITMDSVVTYIMGASSMTSRLINHFAPNVDVLRPGTNCVLVVVKKV